MKRGVSIAVAVVAGLGLGAVATLTWQGRATDVVRSRQRVEAAVEISSEVPTTFLVWIPRGIPDGFVEDVRSLADIAEVTAVAEEIVWLRRSWSAAGELVDRPPGAFRYPVDAAAVDPVAFASFLPPPDRAAMAAVANGDGILGATSAGLRGLGPGAVMEVGGERIRIAAVLPDELVGAAELVVSSRVGRRLGIDSDRYLLVRGSGGSLTSGRLASSLRPFLPPELGVNRAIQVRAPGDTPFFRAGDSVLPPVLVKALFGEFAAKARPGHPGDLIVEPAWTSEHIVTTDLPLLGPMTCHRAILAQLASAMQRLAERGLSRLVRSTHGCYVPRFVGRDPSNMISFHSWGIAFDLNLAGNYRGVPPHQDQRLVEVLARSGFGWGGAWIVPDGSHFEYRFAPEG